MNCTANIVKYIFCILNVILAICGILLIVFGSLTVHSTESDTIPILIILLGCVVFIISFVGCCGAIRESVCCTLTYAVIMFILFVLQLASVITSLVNYNEALRNAGNAVNLAWEENSDGDGYDMNRFQIELKCCGLTGYMDYIKNDLPVPPSCCGITSGACPSNEYKSKPGCRKEYHDLLSLILNITCYAGIGMALLELVAFSFACCLAISIGKSNRM